MKVTVFVRNDHEALKSLFGRFNKPGIRQPNGRKELFNEIRREILMHSQIESEIFYPALAGSASARAVELIGIAEHEHQAVEKLLQELEDMNTSDQNFEEKMNQ